MHICKSISNYVAIVVALSSAWADAADWPQFRGPTGMGVSDETELPLEWGPKKNIRWRVLLPDRGNSSPIVSRGHVFVTVAEDKGRKRTLICIDRRAGKTLWSRTVTYPNVERTHPTNPYCASTPCADGERVIAWYSSAGLHCYDFDGKPLWSRDLGKFVHIWGYGASPILYGDAVVLNCGPGERTFLIALDKRSGKTLWQQDEPGGQSGIVGRQNWVASWSTPGVARIDGRDQIVASFPYHVKGYDPKSGKVLWQCDGLSQIVSASIVIKDGIVVAIADGWGGNSLGIRLGGQGNVTKTHRLWAQRRGSYEAATGVIVDRHHWTVDKTGIILCIDAQTGREVTRGRSPKGAAWGSLIHAAGRLYFTTRSGHTVVLRPDPKAIKILAVNGLGEKTDATPAISDGEIFVRTVSAVYCIADRHLVP